jgi:hypothetical protein
MANEEKEMKKSVSISRRIYMLECRMLECTLQTSATSGHYLNIDEE